MSLLVSIRRFVLVVGFVLGMFVVPSVAEACTGITLKADNGDVVFGRSMEWGAFDLNSRLVIVPRGITLSGTTPDGKKGMTWKTKYGVVGLDGLEKDYLLEGMNEAGLSVGGFYHPGFAEYQKYDPAQADKTMGPLDVANLLLTACGNIDDVKKTLEQVHVVPIVEEKLGITPPLHFIVTEPSGKAVVIEFLKGKTVFFDAPLGVITNAPTYDWHMINLRNYLNLSPVALPAKKIEDLDFTPLGGGSGLIGLPGDYTPPSRFVRAVAFTQTARKTPNGDETVYELFRILDNFNLPLGAAEGSSDESDLTGMRSSTIWTTASDTGNKKFYYHTQHNRRVRMIDLKKIDFGKEGSVVRFPLDEKKEQDVVEIELK